jgi:FAD/FMN-containing dehydrogenase
MSGVSAAALSALRQSLSGDVITPDDDGYDAARSVWNADIDRRPALVVCPRSAEDVVAAIGFARAEALDFTVRGGGHNYAGHAVADDALMINLSAMNSVEVDPVSRRARVGGGATWAELDATTQAHGLGVTGGFISHTGVAGLTLGGGIGWLTRRCGLSCDSLIGAQVVTADGRVVTASAQENPDLLWALRGGGGNFGVVTTFEFALHEVPPMANLGMFFWLPEQARGPIAFARDHLRSLPPEMGALIGGMSAPPEPFVPEEFHFRPGFAVLVVSWGSPEEHGEAVAPLRSLAPSFEMVTPIPYVMLQQMFNGAAAWGSYAYEKAVYLAELSDGVIDAMLEHMPRASSPMNFVPIFPLGGAYSDVADDACAFGGSRREGWVFNISGAAMTAEGLAPQRAWTREFWDAVRPYAADSASYVNFIADPDEERVRASYGAKYERLAAIKAKWDPENLFCHNANIKPAGGVPAQVDLSGHTSEDILPTA